MNRIVKHKRNKQWLFELLRFFPDDIYNHAHYFSVYKRFLKTKNPEFYSDILFSMKMSEPSTLQVRCCDKATIKDYIREQGLKEHVIEPIDIQNDPNLLTLDQYPLPYMIKVSNASHCNVEVVSKDDIPNAKDQIKAFVKIDHSLYYRENCYKFAKRSYIVEPRLGPLDYSLADYKVHCFDGKPTYIQINYPDTEHNDRVMIDFNNDPVEYPFVSGRTGDTVWDIRKHLELMYSISEKLSQPFVFVRVDFLIVDDRLYVTEMTFYPSGGLVLRRSDRINREWGQLIPYKGRDLRDGY
jgi:hypothetical protein